MRNTFFKRTLTAAAVATAMGLSATAVAQSTTGSVSGQIVTTSDAAVEGANVTIRNIETGFTRTVQVDADGNYRFASLPTGRYVIVANASGYEPNESQEFVISAGGSRELTVPLATGIETVDVSGSAISMLDTRSSGTALNIGEAQIDRIPVPRNATNVALLAPSTTAGDSRFGNLASFGGSSVAENAVYINGLNVTNFRTGTGFSEVPFEFYKEFEVKTGGYSAEFGRSTGGVINTVVKSGTNEWEFGANLYYTPDSFSEDSPNVRFAAAEAATDYYIYNAADSRDEYEGNIYASGPIIEDTLFIYALYNPRNIERESVGTNGETFFDDSTDDAFWGAKVDWQISSDHLLELLAFSDSTTTDTLSYGYDTSTGERSGPPGVSYAENGGKNYSATYTGYLTNDLTVSVMYGENQYDLSSNSDEFAYCSLIRDYRTNVTPPNGVEAGCADTSTYFGETGEDTRKAFRVDFEWYLGDHLLKFGYDREENTSTSQTSYSGPEQSYYFVETGTPGEQLAGGNTVPAGVDEYVMAREYRVNGDFETIGSAFYIEDQWSITDDVTATIGLRNDTFNNKNANGESFVKIDNMWAPRLGISWDVNGDGESKLFANVGRYFLPVANNTNVRLSGNEYDVRTFYDLNSATVGQIEGQDSLILDLGPAFGEVVNADGSIPDTRAIVDQDIDPMYQDEYIIGYEAAFAENWSWGIRGIRRELNGAIDDMEISSYLDDTYGCHIGNGYVLGNPGEDTTILARTDCANEVDELITFNLAELGYPEGQRSYNAVEVTLARAFADGWSLNASYTWAHSYGNTEGLVKSDIAQDDAGITQDFDFPELMDGAYGDLPNDRRHMFKAYGSYELTENLRVGANFRLESGRPTNAFGIGHPNGVPSYGDTFYVCTANCDDEANSEYKFFPRGTYGRTPWQARLDMNATYTTQINDFETQFRVDVFNILNAQSVSRVNEFAEESSPGDVNERFMLPTSFQTPRYVMFSASVKF